MESGFFQDECQGKYANMTRKDLGSFENDFLLKNEAARRSFKTFLKWGANRSAETLLSALIRFDAIIPDIIDVLSLIWQNSQLTDCFCCNLMMAAQKYKRKS